MVLFPMLYYFLKKLKREKKLRFPPLKHLFVDYYKGQGI